MPRRAVDLRAGECYHVYNRGNNLQPIFFERANWLFFLKKLREYVAGPTADVLAYCLMTNHYHLLVRLKGDAFSASMQSFAQSYTNAINRRHQRVGSLFQGRFRAIHVGQDEYLVHLSRYIHLNPVAAGLVRRPEEWEFSSYPDYVGFRNGSLPACDRILSYFPSVDAYRRFVYDGIGRRDTRIAHLTLDD